MAAIDADRNLLFGVLALQMDFISRGALVAAVTEWTGDRSKPLGQILVSQGGLTEPRRALLESLVSEHLRAHGGDLEQSLAAVSKLAATDGGSGARGASDFLFTLTRATGSESGATLTWDVGPPTSQGLRFRILRPHARGGIGLVSVALDVELNREVALKEIQDHQADDPGSRTRFVLEAEITGRLEHPGVVPVYGLGSSPAGRPYYAMRLIKGDSLKEAVDRFHIEGGQPWALRGLLNRFVAVCYAVAYAHSRGILHRDLKPANIMLGPYGETLVVDWGLAKVIGRADALDTPEATLRPSGSGGETADGSTVGTPAYMSPEQAEGRLDALGPRSDVYSLGATLYYILTGRPPFADGDLATILRQVRQGEFSSPKAVNSNVSRALDSLCLKAMSLRPDDRYDSARAVAEDLEHWLADEPITAYREPALPRLARWGRRHRPLVAGVAVLLLTTVVALVAGLILLGQAGARTERQRVRAEANYVEAQKQRDLARTNLQTARRAVDDYFVQVSEDTLLNSGLPGLQDLRKKLLESALTSYKEFVRQEGDNPELKKELAQAYSRVGTITAEIGEKPADALVTLGQARDSYELLSRAHPDDPSFRGELARIHRWIGRMQAGAHPAEALASFRRSAALGEELVASHPEVPRFQADLAFSYNNAAAMLSATGEVAEALASQAQAIDVWEGLIGKHPDPEFRVGLGQSYSNFGETAGRAGRPEEAIATIRKGVDVLEIVVRENDAVPLYRQKLGHALAVLGEKYFYLFTDRQSESAECYRKALAIAERLVRENPAVSEFQMTECQVLDDLGHLLARDGRRDAEARTCFETALKRAKNLTSEHYGAFSSAYSYRGLGKLFRKENRPAEALEALQKAVTIGETILLPPYSLYELACARALCSAMVGEGKAELTAAEQEAKNRYADQAMEALHKTIAGGWKTVTWIKADPDLDAIRSRADFQALIRSLEDKQKTESKAAPGNSTRQLRNTKGTAKN
jgi:eukaryotic-like serine/threonine-protein kinase